MKFIVYAAVDLNLIDGSSTWLTAVSDVLSRNPDNRVCVPLRTDLQNRRLVGTLDGRANVTLVNPFAPDGELLPTDYPRPAKPRLSPEEAEARILEIDRKFQADFIITRDEITSERIALNPVLTGRHVAYMTNLHGCEGERADRIRRIVAGSRTILCQTHLVAADLKAIVPDIPDSKIILLPPIVPDVNDFQPRQAASRNPTLVYAGKFSPSYYSIETLSAFSNIRASNPLARFMVLGDKFHNHPPVDDFEQRVRAGLDGSGVDWLGAASREMVQQRLQQADIGASWRDAEMARSPEISTKVLEYASAGLPILLRRGALYEDLFGHDYAGFVETADDFVRAFNRLSSDAGLYSETSSISVHNARQFSMDAVSARLNAAFRSQMQSGTSPSREISTPMAKKKRLVIAGHKLNFVEPLIDYFRSTNQYEIELDEWKNHTVHDEARSRELVDWADAIFCEWCLGNAVWYSNNKRADQKLVVRLHAQEMGLAYKNEMNWERVDSLISISPQNHGILLKDHAAYRDKISLIFNCFPTTDFHRPKAEDARFNLGLVGFVPKIKRADLAVDLLKRLKAHDDRFHLFILGKQPEEYAWMLKREDEMRWYADVRESIKREGFEQSVTFDPFTDDPAAWYAKIGFLLSVSDHEGSHQAVAEGMASGARPIMRDWFGADMLYPPEHVFENMDAATEMVLDLLEGFDADGKGTEMSNDAFQRFDTSIIGPRVEALFD